MQYSTHPRAREMRIRRALQRNGERLTKLRLNAEDAEIYGPYAILNINENSIVAHGMDLDSIEARLKRTK